MKKIEGKMAALKELSATRKLQLALALVWLLDAALQFQPYMFTRAFATQTLAPAVQGQPGWISTPGMWSVHLIAGHPVFWNALFAVTQLAIAVGLFRRQTVRLALVVSIVWSLSVWWLGEGLGGICSAGASPLMGAPGAVILYAVLAVFAWPRQVPAGVSLAESSRFGSRWSTVGWLALWSYFACLSIPTSGVVKATSTMLAGMTDGEPGWLASTDSWAASLFAHSVTLTVLTALFAVLAVGIFFPSRRLTLVVVACVVSALIWLLEDFGCILTGGATDPNSGLLLVMIALSFLPSARNRREASGVPAVQR